MTSDELNETLRELVRLTVEESREGFALLMVASAIDNEIYGPFLTRDEALAFAESVDGSTFELSAREI
jgi:hypothetical protein